MRSMLWPASRLDANGGLAEESLAGLEEMASVYVIVDAVGINRTYNGENAAASLVANLGADVAEVAGITGGLVG